MFVRPKKSGRYTYRQVVQNHRIDGRVRQQTIATLGRLDVLQAQGQFDGVVRSCARFTQNVSVLDAYQRQELPAATAVTIGPPWVFGRLWQELGLPAILQELLAGRCAASCGRATRPSSRPWCPSWTGCVSASTSRTVSWCRRWA